MAHTPPHFAITQLSRFRPPTPEEQVELDSLGIGGAQPFKSSILVKVPEGFHLPTPEEATELGAPTEAAKVQLGNIESFRQGMAKGLAIVGIPIDAANAALSTIGIPTADEPFLGQKHLRRMMVLPEERFEVTNPFLERVGEEVGATLPALAATMGVVGKAVSKLPLLTPAKPGVTAALKDNIINDLARLGPAKLASMELLLATGSGAGAAGAEMAFPDSQTAEIVGQLIGSLGLAGTIGALRTVKELIASKLPPTGSRAVNAVGNALDSRITRPSALREGQDEVADLQETIPDFRPTTAQTSNDPGLIGLERGTIRGSSGGGFKDIELTNNTALRNALEDVPQTGGASTGDVQKAIQAKFDEVQNVLARNINRRIEVMGGVLTKQQTGKVVRAEMLKAQKALRDQAEIDFSAIDPEGVVELPTDLIVKRAKDLVEAQRQFDRPRDLPDIINKIVKKPGEADVPGFTPDVGGPGAIGAGIPEGAALPARMSFDDLRSLRSRLTNEIREAKTGITPNRPLARNLEQLLESVEGTLDDLSLSTEYPGAAKRYLDARTRFREGAERLRQGPAAEVTARKATGEFAIDDSSVVGRFFNAGKNARDDAQAFKRALGGSQEAQIALREFAVADLQSLPGLTPKRFSAWLSKHKEALDEFPAIKDEFSSVQKSQAAIEAGLGRIERTIADLDKSAAPLT